MANMSLKKLLLLGLGLTVLTIVLGVDSCDSSTSDYSPFDDDDEWESADEKWRKNLMREFK